MNQRNIEALTDLLMASEILDGADRGNYRYFAVELASRGVLVPSALTDEELANLVDPYGTDPDEEVAQDARRNLERIAKGEGEIA